MRTSALLEQIAQEQRGEAIAIGTLFDRLADRGMGLVILLFVLPNCIPIFSVPGVSAVTGLPIFIIAMEMALGKQSVVLPAPLRAKHIPVAGFTRILRLLVPALRWCEMLIKERRYSFFERHERFIGCVLMIMAIILALPMPFLNFLPAVCIAIIALGIVEKDGLAVTLGLILSAIALYLLTLIIDTLIALVLGWL
ncbi:MAG: exopolysaccharide biosynthesis protein [Alphaproteobacteria bacterium]|nr:exopolysaccharide biosynthesis protein [Alphaproteobacteria bacterium]